MSDSDMLLSIRVASSFLFLEHAALQFLALNLFRDNAQSCLKRGGSVHTHCTMSHVDDHSITTGLHSNNAVIR